ncbi:exosortase/archaeosortase family protein [Microbacterium sp. B24]|uniref:exosortase/archaeosortase family protein n=1 Tax=Microbacterium sp. B24 TaxID=95616 RepID=UPI0011D1C21E
MRWLPRWLLALVVLAVLVSAFTFLPRVLAAEADLASRLLTAAFRIPAYSPDTLPYVVYMNDPTYALQVTTECSAVFLTAPFLAVAALILLSRRFSATRIMVSLLLSVGLIVAVNELRIAFVGAALSWWGVEGYGWAHTVVGSILSIAAIAGAVVLSYFILRKGSRSDARREVVQ